MQVTAYWLLPVIVLLVIIAGAAYLALSFYFQQEVSAGDGEPAAFSTASDKVEASELLNAYLQAIGGRDALNQVRSVRYEGRVIFGSGQNEFQMLLLKPDKGMLVTNPGEAGSLKLMLNADYAWQVVENRVGAREISPLDELGTQSLQWSLRVHNTFRRIALEGQSVGLSVRQMEYLGKPCYEVSKAMPNETDFKAILEKETLYLLKTEETISGKDGKDKFTVLYDDHRMVSGIIEPYETKLYRNGKMDNEVVIDSIRINTGVISSLFEVPEEILR